MGEVLEVETYMVELREYLVTFDLKKKVFINKEQNIFSRENISSNISMTMCQLKSIMLSKKYKEKMQNAYFYLFDNFVLLPKINRNGDINGCYLMINYFPVPNGVFKITSSE